MPVDLPEVARQYLTPGRGAFWRWSSDGTAVEWTSGLTIAFRQELIDVVRYLSARGLPPLEEVLMVLAMGRGASGPNEDGVEGRLAALPTLSPELIAAADSSGHLVELLTTSAGRDPGVGPAVLRALESGFPPGTIGPQGRPAVGFRQVVARITGALRTLDLVGVALWSRTGLTQIPDAAEEVVLPDRVRVRSLVSALLDDHQLSGLASLARDLMAAVHVPRPVADPEDLPLGGLSGIANRGPFDRLLLSELAHDGDALMVRVALGEALYAQREAPPRQPGGARFLLLDAGIRLWGAPRVFATAVGLALTATTDPGLGVSPFRPERDALVPVDLGSREGVVRHLEALSTDPHPGPALTAFFDRCVQDGGLADAVIVTHRDTLSDPDFRIRMGPPPGVDLWVVTVDAEGGVGVFAASLAGVRLVAEARLDLQRLQPTSPEVAVPPGANGGFDPELPSFLMLRPPPVRFPLGPGGQWSATEDLCFQRGRLLHAQRDGKGAQEVAVDLNHRVALCLARTEAGAALVVAYDAPRLRLVAVHVDLEVGVVGRLEIVPPSLRRRDLLGVHYRHGLIWTVQRRHVAAFHAASGAEVARLVIGAGPGEEETVLTDCRGPYVQDTKGRWSVLAWDGQSLRLEVASGVPGPRPDPLLCRSRVLYHSLTHILPGRGSLAVRTKKGATIALAPSPAGVAFEPADLTDLPRVRFVSTGAPTGHRYVLHRADFGDGARAFTDSRGLLHLIDPGMPVPEMALFLVTHGEVAAWFSDGTTAGDPFFFSAPPRVTSSRILDWVAEFARRRV